MSWIKKSKEVVVIEELESNDSRIQTSNAYEVEITGARLAESKQDNSKSLSLVIDVKTDDGETAREFLTIQGKDGNTFFIDKRTKVKKQHIGLTIANSLFQLVLDKEIFDAEPEEIKYEAWNKDDEEMEELDGHGFPELIGKKIGVCVQIERVIEGADSKETPRIEHFFNHETGLFNKEVLEDGKKTKLDKWLDKKKEFKEIIKEVVEKKSAFAAKTTTEKTEIAEEPKKNKWGR